MSQEITNFGNTALDIDHEQIRRLGLLLAFTDSEGRLICNRPDTVQLTDDDMALLDSYADKVFAYSLETAAWQQLQETLNFRDTERLPQHGHMVLYRIGDNAIVPFIVGPWLENDRIPYGLKRFISAIRGIFTFDDENSSVFRARHDDETGSFYGKITGCFGDGINAFSEIVDTYELYGKPYGSFSRELVGGDILIQMTDTRVIAAIQANIALPAPQPPISPFSAFTP